MQVDLLAGSEAVLRYVTRGDSLDRSQARARFTAFGAALARHGRPLGFDGHARRAWAGLSGSADSLENASDALRSAIRLRDEASALLDQSLTPALDSVVAPVLEQRTVQKRDRIAAHQRRERDVRTLTAHR